tara:strand:+ start:19801 stop:20460 length:660 start_codon:yes stop_codon:yes gene_type:complete
MLYITHKLLNEEKVREFQKELLISSDWIDGKYSAQGNAKQIKRNLQLKESQSKEKLEDKIRNLLLEDNHIRYSVFPAKIFNILFSRTGVGMYYGPHVDTAYIPSGRRDLSFTLFLNDPKDYDGGELILSIPPETKKIKMKPGEMIIYPTKYLHEVKEVTKGERMVCVGWIESQIKSDEDRSNLFLLYLVNSEIKQNYGSSGTTQKLNIAVNNIHKRFLD